MPARAWGFKSPLRHQLNARSDLPRTAARLVELWPIERQSELVAKWDLAQVPAPLGTIEPLQ